MEENSFELEEEKIFNQDEDPSFAELRASIEESSKEDIEQPDEDNSRDSDIDTDDVGTGEESEGQEEISNDQASEKDETQDVDTADKVEKYKIKANGMDFEFTTDELVALAPKAMDYTKKMQELSPWRKSISALKEAGLTQEDLNLAIDVLKGDKAAIKEVAKRNELDLDTLAFDEDEQAAYIPTQYGKDDSQLAIEEIVSQISGDPEYAITRQVVDGQWDGKSREILAAKPEMISALHNDIKSGVYDAVSPMAFKLKVLDGGSKSDLEYYIKAGEQYYAGLEQNNLKNKAEEVNAIENNNAKQADAAKTRKAAGTTKNSAGKKDIIDYLDDDDEKFDEWYKNVTKNF